MYGGLGFYHCFMQLIVFLCCHLLKSDVEAKNVTMGIPMKGAACLQSVTAQNCSKLILCCLTHIGKSPFQVAWILPAFADYFNLWCMK